MITIREAIVDLADCGTTLAYFGPAAAEGSLPFKDGSAYCDFYQSIAEARPGQMPDPRSLPKADMLVRLNPAYHGNRYWHKQLNQRSRQSYPRLAWARLIPLEARLKLRLAPFRPEGIPEGNVLPVLRVLLYPFGWSTWVSLLVRGRYSLADLADLVDRIVRDEVLVLEGKERTVTLNDLFDRVGAGVRQDAFNATTEFQWPPERLSVVTVLEKSGAALAVEALPAQYQPILWRLLQPGEKPPNKDVTKTAHTTKLGDKNFDFVLQEGLGAFLWLQNLLTPGPRHKDHLRCYHNNTFRALLQAWQLWAFLDETLAHPAEGPGHAALAELFRSAVDQLIDQAPPSKSSYTNAALVEFLNRADVRSSISAANNARLVGGMMYR